MSGRFRLGAVIVLTCMAGAVQAQEGDVAKGGELYEEHCSSCHGERLRATGAAPDLKTLAAEDREKFVTRVREGKGQMPSWDGVLPDEDRDSIWAYIRSRAR